MSHAARFEIVISAENTPYQAWQALLCHHSCLVHGMQAPLVVVHGDEANLVEPFEQLRAKGGRIARAPNYRATGEHIYPPRNSAASLRHACADADYLVLCDADMLLLKPWNLGDFALAPRQVSFDEVSYLHVNEERRAAIEAACGRLGVPIARIERSAISGGVPHIIPIALRHELADTWLQAIEAFHPNDVPATELAPRHLPWETLASMWALVLAVHQLDLEPVMTQFSTTNYQGAQSLQSSANPAATLLHYCYSDVDFDKRWYKGDGHDPGLVWQARGAPGSLHAQLCSALYAAGVFFGYLAPQGCGTELMD